MVGRDRKECYGTGAPHFCCDVPYIYTDYTVASLPTIQRLPQYSKVTIRRLGALRRVPG